MSTPIFLMRRMRPITEICKFIKNRIFIQKLQCFAWELIPIPQVAQYYHVKASKGGENAIFYLVAGKLAVKK